MVSRKTLSRDSSTGVSQQRSVDYDLEISLTTGSPRLVDGFLISLSRRLSVDTITKMTACVKKDKRKEERRAEEKAQEN